MLKCDLIRAEAQKEHCNNTDCYGEDELPMLTEPFHKGLWLILTLWDFGWIWALESYVLVWSNSWESVLQEGIVTGARKIGTKLA